MQAILRFRLTKDNEGQPCTDIIMVDPTTKEQHAITRFEGWIAIPEQILITQEVEKLLSVKQ